ncbi:hypothetical protein ABI59_16850 [Acidobacteria bacterium Mor1]|nr:hypothetical protein ABI59_16850 [Acidobacteria bacterium Mor1]
MDGIIECFIGFAADCQDQVLVAVTEWLIEQSNASTVRRGLRKVSIRAVPPLILELLRTHTA